MSYYECTPEERRQYGIPDNMIRLACGIENPEDLVADGPGPASGWPRAVCVAADMISPETHSVTRVRRIKVFILIPVLFVA